MRLFQNLLFIHHIYWRDDWMWNSLTICKHDFCMRRPTKRKQENFESRSFNMSLRLSCSMIAMKVKVSFIALCLGIAVVEEPIDSVTPWEALPIPSQILLACLAVKPRSYTAVPRHFVISHLQLTCSFRDFRASNKIFWQTYPHPLVDIFNNSFRRKIMTTKLFGFCCYQLCTFS